MKHSGITLATTLLFVLPGSAKAADFMLDYASNGAAPLTANLVITTSDLLNGVGGYDVTGISGNVSGDAITGLSVNPGQPNAHYSPDGLFIYDNVYYPGAPSVSYWGLLFTSAAHEYNLFSDNATTYELYQATPGLGYTQNSVGSLLVTRIGDQPAGAVPEPASWVAMALGFGLLGGLMRGQRKTALQVACQPARAYSPSSPLRLSRVSQEQPGFDFRSILVAANSLGFNPPE